MAGLFTGVFAALAAEEEVLLVFGLGGQQIGLYARDAVGDHLDRWNLNHPRTGSVLKTNPPAEMPGGFFVCMSELCGIFVSTNRDLTLQCLDIVEFFFFSS